MIDHITFGVADLARSTAFYSAVLAPLGMKRLIEVPAAQSGSHAFVGFGDERPFFWLGESGALSGRLHVALVAQTRRAVDDFHRAALAAGAADNGPPGPRPWYGPDYYGGVVLDPAGHNIEAVRRAPA